MANINFKCPSCGDTLQATPDMSGDNIECPNCNNSILVPQTSTIMAPIGGNKKSNKKTIILGIVFIIILLLFMKKVLFKKKKEPKKKPEKEHVEAAVAQPVPAPEPEVETIEFPEDKINIGDTKDKVLSTIGNPKSSMKMGSTELLIYKNAEITIGAEGKVTAKQYRKMR